MDSVEKFWITFWAIACTAFIVLVATIAISHSHTIDKFTEMVKAGADPILLDCALWNEDKAMCTARALTLKVKPS